MPTMQTGSQFPPPTATVHPLSHSHTTPSNVSPSHPTPSLLIFSRSEVTSAAIATNAYTYAFIGNHTTSTVDSVATTYAANSLNQYTSILRAPVPPREENFGVCPLN